MIRRSFTAVIARNEPWTGEVATEPYECAWAGDAIFFVRALDARGTLRAAKARVQISPDGIHWVDEGTAFPMPPKKGGMTSAGSATSAASSASWPGSRSAPPPRCS